MTAPNVSIPPYHPVMDDDDGYTRSLFPELLPLEPRWEVTFTRERKAGDALVPCAPMVPRVTAWYTAETAQAVAEVRAAGPDAAVAAARELCAGMPWVATAEAEALPAEAGDVRQMTQVADRQLP